MQATIIAAGRGQRLEPISDGKPKSLIEIGGKTIIDWTLEYFKEAGIKKIIMVVGHQKELCYNHLKRENITYVVNPFYNHGQVLSSFWFLLPEIDLDKDLIFCHADTIIERKIFKKLLETPGDVVLPIDTKECDDEAMKVKIDPASQMIEKITKEMPAVEANGEFIGFAKISKRVLPDLIKVSRHLIENKSIDHYVEAAFQELKDRSISELTPLDISGLEWAEIDFPEDLERARKLKLAS